ncbi:unannotated protein [freshwater metagenome]|uniref:Unannotated protein n=1 Tax=freshwater metagenome TaxID=449393 RepID=A0A6J6JCC1_9ZZZZ|nr:hypothetical protein [Actinomycetota bacterium]
MIKPAFGLALSASANNPASLAKSYGPAHGVRSNHVISQSGAFVGADGSSRSISTPDDRELLIALRIGVDLLVVDAATARREKYKLPGSGSKLAIFSKTGMFHDIPALTDSAGEVYLFGPSTDATIDEAKPVHIRNIELPFEGFSDWAKLRGFDSILLESGPTLAANAFAAGLVKHSALTITPTQVGLEQLAGLHPFDGQARLTSVAYSQDATFTYWSH